MAEVIDGWRGIGLSYSNDENASQGGTGDNEDSAAEQDHQADFLHRPEAPKVLCMNYEVTEMRLAVAVVVATSSPFQTPAP